MSAAAVLRHARELEQLVGEAVGAYFACGDPTDANIARLDAAMTALEDVCNGGRSPGDPTGSNPEGEGSSPSRPAPAPRKKATAAPARPTADARRRSGSAPGSQAGAEPPPSGKKRCPDCKETKPLKEFGNNRTAHDGKQSYCRPCFRTRNRASKQKSRGTSSRGAGDKEGSRVPAVVDRPRPAPAGRKVRHGAIDTPLPGAPAFTVTLTCSRCSLDERSSHPHADDQPAIAEALRRVEQALHDCPGTLTATVAADTGPRLADVVTLRQPRLPAVAERAR